MMSGRALPAFDAELCTRLMQGGSKSFFAASLLLPRPARLAATALYAFCRVADDAVDECGRDPACKAEAVAELLARLDAIYCGQPGEADADVAMAWVVAAYRIPKALPAALVEGFAWDAEARQYDTLEQLHDYAARVAGTVGAMMALVLGVRQPSALARACELGVAMQLTNIARDVGGDAAEGRLFLPRSWLREVGIEPDVWLAAPQFDPRLAQVVHRLLAEAERLYQRAEAGIAQLPVACRPAIAAARWVYAEIGREVERAGGDSVSRRAVVSAQRKGALMAKAVTARFTLAWAAQQARHAHQREAPPLPAVAYLVDAATSALDPALAGLPAPASSFYDRTVWLLEASERRWQAAQDRHTPLFG
jgi:phytoene synthase